MVLSLFPPGKDTFSWVPLSVVEGTDIITMSCFPLRFKPYPARHLSSLRESIDLRHRSKGHDLAGLLSRVLSHV